MSRTAQRKSARRRSLGIGAAGLMLFGATTFLGGPRFLGVAGALLFFPGAIVAWLSGALPYEAVDG